MSAVYTHLQPALRHLRLLGRAAARGTCLLGGRAYCQMPCACGSSSQLASLSGQQGAGGCAAAHPLTQLLSFGCWQGGGKGRRLRLPSSLASRRDHGRGSCLAGCGSGIAVQVEISTGWSAAGGTCSKARGGAAGSRRCRLLPARPSALGPPALVQVVGRHSAPTACIPFRSLVAPPQR